MVALHRSGVCRDLNSAEKSSLGIKGAYRKDPCLGDGITLEGFGRGRVNGKDGALGYTMDMACFQGGKDSVEEETNT